MIVEVDNGDPVKSFRAIVIAFHQGMAICEPFKRLDRWCGEFGTYHGDLTPDLHFAPVYWNSSITFLP